MKRIRCIVFLLLGILFFDHIQRICIPNWVDSGNPQMVIKGIDALDSNELDAVFLGSSLVYAGISPMILYRDAGIVAYNLATSAQPLECSLCLLNKLYNTQHPKVVFLDAGALFYDDELQKNAYWRYVLDSLPLCPDKIKLGIKYVKCVENNDGFMSVIFPLIKYHSRWSQLLEEDLKLYDDNSFYYSGGYYVDSQIVSATRTLDFIDEWDEKLRNQSVGEETHILENEKETVQIKEPIYVHQISDNNLKQFMEIKNLCDKQGTTLVLIKIPMRTLTQYDNASWTMYKSNLTKVLMEEYEIPFLDLQYDADLHLDFKFDTKDGGKHLNLLGAEKVSKYFSDYIKNNFKISPHKNKIYDEALEKYMDISNVAKLELETDFGTYISKLTEIDNKIVIISAQSDYISGLDSCSLKKLEEMGLKLIADGAFMDSYIAIINNGQVFYEAVSNRKIEYNTECESNIIEIESSGWSNGSYSSIKINGIEYSQNSSGLNIVVWDNDYEIPIDSVAFNTYVETKDASRDKEKIWDMLRDYEEKRCFN